MNIYNKIVHFERNIFNIPSGKAGKNFITELMFEVIARFRVQFRINKQESIIQRLTKLHETVGRMQFVVFEKLTSAYLS